MKMLISSSDNKIIFFNAGLFDQTDKRTTAFFKTGRVRFMTDQFNKDNSIIVEVENSKEEFVGKRFDFSGDAALCKNLDHYSIDEEFCRYDPQKVIDEQNLYLKLNARTRIFNEVGDLSDQIADVDKQINVMTGMIVRTYKLLRTLVAEVPPDIIPADILTKFDQFADLFTTAVDEGTYFDRTDIEDPTEIIQNLMQKNIKKAQIVKAEYLDKKIQRDK